MARARLAIAGFIALLAIVPWQSVQAGMAGAAAATVAPPDAISATPHITKSPVRRATPQPVTPPAKPRVMVALVLGQSNAASFGEGRRTANPNVQVLLYGKLIRAKDPLVGTNGQGGSVWTRLGDQLIAARRYDRVIFIAAAVGSTEISRWAPPAGDLWPLISGQIDEAAKAGLTITHVFWHQGESDAALNTAYSEYQIKFRDIWRGLREKGVRAPIFVARASRCGQYPPSKDIRGAQAELVNHDIGVWAGPDTDALGSEWRVGDCHFNAKGLEEHAKLWAAAIALYDGPR